MAQEWANSTELVDTPSGSVSGRLIFDPSWVSSSSPVSAVGPHLDALPVFFVEGASFPPVPSTSLSVDVLPGLPHLVSGEAGRSVAVGLPQRFAGEDFSSSGLPHLVVGDEERPSVGFPLLLSGDDFSPSGLPHLVVGDGKRPSAGFALPLPEDNCTPSGLPHFVVGEGDLPSSGFAHLLS